MNPRGPIRNVRRNSRGYGVLHEILAVPVLLLTSCIPALSYLDRTLHPPADKPHIELLALLGAGGTSGTGGAGATPYDQVSTPLFSLSSGSYSIGASLTISCSTPGATIYYTTDGSTPTTSSVQYSGQIFLYEAMTVKAIAVKPGMQNSTVESAQYTVYAPG